MKFSTRLVNLFGGLADGIQMDEVISTVALADQVSREFNVGDQGIDMELELTDDTPEAAGAKRYLQLKSGDSYLRERKRDGVGIFTIKDGAGVLCAAGDPEFRGR